MPNISYWTNKTDKRLSSMMIDKLQAENAELSEDIEGLEKTIDELETDIAALQAENKEILARYDSTDECYKEFIDEISKATGAFDWEYPGQVIRDVQKLQAEKERLISLLDTANNIISRSQEQIATLRDALNSIVNYGSNWSANKMGGVALQRKRWQRLVEVAQAALKAGDNHTRGDE